MGVELPLRVVFTVLECCVTFSGVKLSIRSFVLFQFILSVVLWLLKHKAEQPAPLHHDEICGLGLQGTQLIHLIGLMNN